MSLDVYLYGKPETLKCICRECENEHTKTIRGIFFSSNITHNLNRTAQAAGIYQACRFKAFDAENGCGTYEHFVPWVRDYLAACRAYPDATVEASR